MGNDAPSSARSWRRHLRGVSRSRAAKSGDDPERGTLFFSARELGVLAVTFIEWSLYIFITWGVLYLVFTDRMPKAAQVDQPVYWLDPKPKPAARSEARSEPASCLAVVEELAPAQESDLSPEFKRGFEAAIQVMVQRLEHSERAGP